MASWQDWAIRAWYFIILLATFLLAMLLMHGVSLLPINSYPFSSLPQSLQDHLMSVATERIQSIEDRNLKESKPIDGEFQVILFPEPCIRTTHKKPEEVKFVGFLEFMCENEEVTQWCSTSDYMYKSTEKVISRTSEYGVRVIFSCFRLYGHNRFAQDHHVTFAYVCAVYIPILAFVRLYFLDKEKEAQETEKHRALQPRNTGRAPLAGLISRHQNFRRRR